MLLPLFLLAAKSPEKTVEIPKGTVLTLELVDAVSSGKNKPGDCFRAKLEDGIWVRGRVAVPPGTTLRGVLPEVTASGRVKGQAHLALTLTTVDLDGKKYSISTDTLTYAGETHAGKHWGSSFMGAMQGALYGVLFGGKQGAILGAGAGAAASTAASILGGKLDVEFEQGAKLMFETMESFSVPDIPEAERQREKTEKKAEPEKKEEQPQKSTDTAKTGKPST